VPHGLTNTTTPSQVKFQPSAPRQRGIYRKPPVPDKNKQSNYIKKNKFRSDPRRAKTVNNTGSGQFSYAALVSKHVQSKFTKIANFKQHNT
jgi:hypothetical protein